MWTEFSVGKFYETHKNVMQIRAKQKQMHTTHSDDKPKDQISYANRDQNKTQLFDWWQALVFIKRVYMHMVCECVCVINWW